MAKPRGRKKRIRTNVGPSSVKWIKIVPDPTTTNPPTAPRVYFETQDIATGTFQHGFFDLNSAAALADLNILLDQMTGVGASSTATNLVTYRTTPSLRTNMNYLSFDSFRKASGGVPVTPMIADTSDHEVSNTFARVP